MRDVIISFFTSFVNSFGLLDLLDTLVIAIFLYYFFLLIKGTRAVQILKGVGILLAIMLISRTLGLHTVYWLLQFLLYGIAVALPIVFQPELRRALGYIGRGEGLRGFLAGMSGDVESAGHVIDAVLWSVDQMSQTRTGALIVLERNTGLEEYIETGTSLDSEVSAKLLLSIFNTKSPLHDGAVIIRNFKIFSASCYLPLSENVSKTKGKGYGTRHRAALGLSEQSDAIVIVVSEETGNISVARNGKLTRYTSIESLKKFLFSLWNSEKKGANIAITDVFKKKPSS